MKDEGKLWARAISARRKCGPRTGRTSGYPASERPQGSRPTRLLSSSRVFVSTNNRFRNSSVIPVLGLDLRNMSDMCHALPSLRTPAIANLFCVERRERHLQLTRKTGTDEKCPERLRIFLPLQALLRRCRHGPAVAESLYSTFDLIKSSHREEQYRLVTVERDMTTGRGSNSARLSLMRAWGSQ